MPLQARALLPVPPAGLPPGDRVTLAGNAAGLTQGAMAPGASTPPGAVPALGATPPVNVATEVPVETEAARKQRLARELVRSAPTPALAARVSETLQAYPLRALEIVHGYGTRFEIFAVERADQLPEYMSILAEESILGAYNTQQNVIGMLAHNVNPFTILHEFGHALDHAMGDRSQSDDWQEAYHRARAQNCAVRQNARANEKEYLADNVAAWLIPDRSLPPMVAQGQRQNGLIALDRQDYSHDRLHQKDPRGYDLAEQLLQRDIYSAATG